jgi:hypothetical protein
MISRAAAGGWLAYDNSLGMSDLVSLLSRLSSDPNVSLGTKLYTEDYLYQLNEL